MSKNQFKNQPRQDHSSVRIRVVFLCALLVVVLFLARLFYLQVVAGSTYQEAALAQRRRTITVKPKRGTIYDRADRPLAVSVMVNTVYVFPKEIKAEDKKKTVELLAYILGMEKEEVEKALSSNRYDVALKTKLTQSEIDQLQSSGLQAYRVVQEPDRFYPNQDIMAQSLGFVNNEGGGIYGLESKYDALLRGKGGQTTTSRDLGGNIIPTESVENYASEEGQNLHLTVDLEAQRIVSEQLRKGLSEFKADSGTAILMNPNTGEIIAMESAPTFNPNTPYAPVNDKGKAAWKAMKEEERMKMLYARWKNPAITTLYEPGSVFKTLTASIALETKTSRPDSRYTCTGKIEIAPGVWAHCWRESHPHGIQTLEQALNNSCNPAFVQIVRNIGVNNYFSYLRSLHMGGITGVDLPGEQASLFPQTVGKLDKIQMQTMSFGHGISLTPLEMMTAANTVINGGYYRTPHFFSSSTSQEGKTLSRYQQSITDPIFSQETVATMRKYLLSTTEVSHAKVLRIKELSIGSKSGTTLLLENGKYTDKTIASLYSFYPYDKPEMALFVMIHNPTKQTFGGEVAGEVSARILEQLVALKKKATQPSNEGKVVPNVCRKTVAEARKLLNNAGFSCSVYGAMNDFTLVEEQNPAPGTIKAEQTTIELRPDAKQSYKAPDLTGKSVREAQMLLGGTGISLSINGEKEGVIRTQTPEAGAIAGKDTPIIINVEAQSTEAKGSASSQ